MLDMMIHHMTMLLIAGIGLGSPMPTSSAVDEPACVTSVHVTAAISNNAIVTTATPDKGTACSSGTCTFHATPGTSVAVTYTTSNNQFLYDDASSNMLRPAPGHITTPSQSGSSSAIDFAVMGANNDTVLFHDPKITVTAGNCTTSF